MSEWEPTDAPVIPEPVFGTASEPVPESAPPPARRFNRKRVLWITTSVITAAALVTVGVVALLPGRSGDSIVAKVRCQPKALATCLIKPPAGSNQLLPGTDADTWPKQVSPGAELYTSNITGDVTGMKNFTVSLLDADGMRDIVHTDWNAVDGDNVDLVVLAFGTQKGARAWNATRAAEVVAAYPGQSVAIPGDSTATAHAAAKPDSHGDIGAAYSTVVGDLVLNVAYSSPNQLNAQDLQNWAGTELASLRTAPPAQADPADVAPGAGQVACGRLGSCLAAMPDGSEEWQSPNDPLWVSASTLTTSQMVKLFWDKASSRQSEVTADFNADGVTGIAHRDWDTDNAYKQADIYLIQTIDDAGATALTGSHFGEPDWSPGHLTGVSYQIPGEPDAQAWRTDKTDSSGFIEAYFGETIGNVLVTGWFNFYGSFDADTANQWAKSQIDAVKRSVKTVPMGLFPLTAPALPAPPQASCPAADDCRLPLPAGAADTTATSYQVVPSITTLAYATQYEGASSNEFAQWLGSDGLKSAQHRSWTLAGGDTADAVLLKYAAPAQAQAAAALEYGINIDASNDRDCTDSAVPGSICLAAPVVVSDPLQMETVRVLAWKGDYEVSVSVTRSNTADVADAYTWAQQQLALLPAS